MSIKLAAAALPPVADLGSDALEPPYVLDEKPELAADAVEEGGVVGGTRPGCGWLGGTAGENSAGITECPLYF